MFIFQARDLGTANQSRCQTGSSLWLGINDHEAAGEVGVGVEGKVGVGLMEELGVGVKEEVRAGLGEQLEVGFKGVEEVGLGEEL